MATSKNTAAAVDEEQGNDTEVTATTKATIEEAIQEVVSTFGVSVKRSRLKGLRALAYFALSNAIEDGTLDDLVKQTIDGANELPTGWTLERSTAATPAKPAAKRTAAKPAAKAAPAKKAAAKPAAKAAPARKRPAR